MQTLRADWIWTATGLMADASVTIDTSQIVGTNEPGRHPRVDCDLRGCLLMPGLVNAHSHAFQRSFRGHVQWRNGDDDFWTWRESMYKVANALTPEDVEAVSRLAFLEMVESGITTVGEFHYLHHQPDGTPYADRDELAHRVIAAARSVGLRIVLLRVAYERNSPKEGLHARQRRFGDSDPSHVLKAMERLEAVGDPLVSVGLAPHSVRAVGPQWCRELAAWSGIVHAHVAEQPAEVMACREELDCSPLEALHRAGMVDEKFTAVHLTFPEPGDIALAIRAAANLCACPTTEMDLGDGFLPLHARHPRLCVGSDSHAAIDILLESRSLEMHARALAGRRNVMTPAGQRHGLAERILSIATQNGSHALGQPAGGIAVGQPADLVAIDLRRAAAAGVPPLEAVAFNANPEWVSAVWVGGKRVVSDGRHPDRDGVIAQAEPVLRRVCSEI